MLSTLAHIHMINQMCCLITWFQHKCNVKVQIKGLVDGILCDYVFPIKCHHRRSDSVVWELLCLMYNNHRALSGKQLFERTIHISSHNINERNPQMISMALLHSALSFFSYLQHLSYTSCKPILRSSERLKQRMCSLHKRKVLSSEMIITVLKNILLWNNVIG